LVIRGGPAAATRASASRSPVPDPHRLEVQGSRAQSCVLAPSERRCHTGQHRFNPLFSRCPGPCCCEECRGLRSHGAGQHGDNLAENETWRDRFSAAKPLALPSLGASELADNTCFRPREGGALAPALAPPNSLASFGPKRSFFPCDHAVQLDFTACALGCGPLVLSQLRRKPFLRTFPPADTPFGAFRPSRRADSLPI
jgi:hypothetical protein